MVTQQYKVEEGNFACVKRKDFSNPVFFFRHRGKISVIGLAGYAAATLYSQMKITNSFVKCDELPNLLQSVFESIISTHCLTS